MNSPFHLFRRQASVNAVAAVAMGLLCGPILAIGPNRPIETEPPIDDAPRETTVGAVATNWDQWRGPNRDGTIDGPAQWPSDLSGLTALWRTPLGKGYSGPILSDDVVFVVETISAETEGVRALDRKTGKEIWTQSWSGGMDVPFFAARNGNWVRSTPAYSDDALFVGGMQERFFKLDATTGKILWSIDFPKQFGTKQPEFGFSSSPLVTEDAVYIQAANSILRLDKDTGKVRWRSLENPGSIMDSGAFSSPVLVELAGQAQLVVQTRSTLFGLEPESGSTLWSIDVPSFRGMNILTPTVSGDKIFTSTHRNNSFLFEVIRTDQGFEVVEKWRHKSHGYMSSPVIVGDHVYLHLGNGRVTCISLDSGEQTWTSQSFGDYWSMVSSGKQTLALDERGELLLMELSPTALKVVDQKNLSESPAWGYLAVSGDRIFVRELEAIVAYRWDGIAN